MKKTPLAAVKERFESKEKLVAAVHALKGSDLWLERLSERGLLRVSNAKLLKLHDKITDAKSRFGSREALVSSILELMRRSKDVGLRSKLASYPLPRLLDVHASWTKKAKAAKKASAASASAT
jgi:hypothetical protein